LIAESYPIPISEYVQNELEEIIYDKKMWLSINSCRNLNITNIWFSLEDKIKPHFTMPKMY
jgi:hypothetical protein